MIFIGENGSGTFTLPTPLSVVINSESGVPADDMTVRFLGEPAPELWKIYARRSPGERAVGDESDDIFVGIVDEQITKTDITGSFTEITARSPAALPLDNECEAAQYIDPSLDVILRLHLDRFGISAKERTARHLNGELNISRGQSHYAAVRQFCERFLGTTPRINSVGEFRYDVRTGGETIIFGSGGIGCSQIEIARRRYGRISAVHVISAGNSLIVRDESAAENGIICERRIDLSDSRTGTIFDADTIIANGKKKSLTVRLRCKTRLGDIIGRTARVNIPELDGKDLIVTRIRYTTEGAEEESEVELRIDGNDEFKE